MAADGLASLGAEYRKEMQRLEPRLLFFGATLLMSHVLEITPSDFDAGGFKIAIKDVIVIHGGLSLVFLYYFCTYVSAVLQGSVLMPIQFNKRVIRHLLALAKKPYKDEKTKRMAKRTPKQAKRTAWWNMLAFNLFITPFALSMAAIVLSALVIGVIDAWNFGSYMFDRLVELDV